MKYSVSFLICLLLSPIYVLATDRVIRIVDGQVEFRDGERTRTFSLSRRGALDAYLSPDGKLVAITFSKKGSRQDLQGISINQMHAPHFRERSWIEGPVPVQEYEIEVLGMPLWSNRSEYLYLIGDFGATKSMLFRYDVKGNDLKRIAVVVSQCAIVVGGKFDDNLVCNVREQTLTFITNAYRLLDPRGNDLGEIGEEESDLQEFCDIYGCVMRNWDDGHRPIYQ